MEAQSNPIPEPASVRYARVWADFSASVQRGDAKTLSSYCRETHTSYEGIKYWIRSQGLSVKSLKRPDPAYRGSQAATVTETKAVSFIQFAPSSAPMPSAAMRGVSITFPDGVNLSLQEGNAEDIADLLAIYRSRCRTAGGM